MLFTNHIDPMSKIINNYLHRLLTTISKRQNSFTRKEESHASKKQNTQPYTA